MSGFTPGPWRVNKHGSVGAGEYGVVPIVATIEPFYGPDEQFGNHAANARLIAAAPELYAALVGLIAEIETDGGVDTSEWPLLDAGRAAIAKAGDIADIIA